MARDRGARQREREKERERGETDRERGETRPGDQAQNTHTHGSVVVHFVKRTSRPAGIKQRARAYVYNRGG